MSVIAACAPPHSTWHTHQGTHALKLLTAILTRFNHEIVEAGCRQIYEGLVLAESVGNVHPSVYIPPAPPRLYVHPSIHCYTRCLHPHARICTGRSPNPTRDCDAGIHRAESSALRPTPFAYRAVNPTTVCTADVDE